MSEQLCQRCGGWVNGSVIQCECPIPLLEGSNLGLPGKAPPGLVAAPAPPGGTNGAAPARRKRRTAPQPRGRRKGDPTPAQIARAAHDLRRKKRGRSPDL